MAIFSNLACLVDAIEALHSPAGHADRVRPERLASVSSLSSLTSLSETSCSESPLDSALPSLGPSRADSAAEYLYPSVPRTKVPRKRITSEQTGALQNLFESGVHFPSREMRDRLARQLNLTSRTIQVWFQNRRQAARNKSRSLERPPPGPKLAIRWMKPVIFPGGGTMGTFTEADLKTGALSLGWDCGRIPDTEFPEALPTSSPRLCCNEPPA